ncbi:hypothetical protein LTR49_027828, partial [Elasticomyces elasticus]
MANVGPPPGRDGLGIAILCALKLGRDAVEALMEADFKKQGYMYRKASQDRNVYMTGVLGGKPVVLAFPRDMGNLNAAAVASDMRSSFKNIALVLVVGVAGGAPRTPDETEILLGDVVISTAVIQYDFGRQYSYGSEGKKGLESSPGRHRAARRIRLKIQQYRHDSKFIAGYLFRNPKAELLFPSDYQHKHRGAQACEICSQCMDMYDPVCEEAEKASRSELGCDTNILVRNRRNEWVATQEDDLEARQGRAAKVLFGRV